MQTKINWFEIPANDFNRAVRFYESVFEKKLKIESMGSSQLGVFTNADGESFGGVTHGEGFKPGGDGIIIYLDASPSIDQVITRVKMAGGHISMDKVALPDGMGLIAYFIDLEGNRVGLHAMA